MTIRLSAAFAVAAVTSMSPAHADSADDAAASFVGANGFEVFTDTAVLADILDMTLIDTGRARKDADVTAVEKALLLIEAKEGFVPRARYVVRLGSEFHGEIPVSFVEAERYNLGQLIWQETVDAYGEENTAPVDEFGEGPHVVWRIATQPNTKAAAILLSASRREIGDDEAAGRDCVARTCLSLDPIEFMTEWSEAPAFDIAMPSLAYGLQVAAGEEDNSLGDFDGQHSTALDALQLSAAAGLASVNETGVMWTAEPSQGSGADRPFAEFVVDRNLGQDLGSEGILSVAAMDGDFGERWVRIASSGMDDGVPPTLWSAEGELKPISMEGEQ